MSSSRIWLALTLVALLTTAAEAKFIWLVKRAAPVTSNGKILLVDGVSFILQTDGASKICRAGGC